MFTDPKLQSKWETMTTPKEAKPGDDWLWPTKSRRVTQDITPTHVAIDIGATSQGRIGDPIWSPTRATVTQVARQEGGYGTNIRLLAKNGVEILLGHLSGIAPGVVAGATVQPGQVIGLMGSTGESTAAHLHYELRTPGPLTFHQGWTSTKTAVDPWVFFTPNRDGKGGGMPPISSFTLTPEHPLIPPGAVAQLIARSNNEQGDLVRSR